MIATALPAGSARAQPSRCSAAERDQERPSTKRSLMLPSLLTQPAAISIFRASQVFLSLISSVCL